MKVKKWVAFITAGILALSLICAVIANGVCIDLAVVAVGEMFILVGVEVGGESL